MPVLPPAHPGDRCGGDEDEDQDCAADHGQPASPRLCQTGSPPRRAGWCETSCHASADRSCARGRLGRGRGAAAPAARCCWCTGRRYDDWSFPKGKLDRGEHATAAAVREVAEETGVRVRLGVPLRASATRSAAGTKPVSYWVGRVVGDDDVGGYEPNDEIDEVAWVPDRQGPTPADLRRSTSDTLDEALGARAEDPGPGRAAARPGPLAQGLARATTGCGRCWPPGRHQARAARAAARGVRRAPAGQLVEQLRCVQTLEPYAAATGLASSQHRRLLSEEDATAEAVRC